ncbi:MAG: flagellar basal body-associated FliL family protein [Actinobacteria bacterium]|nr:flagellar basal body-associated FliL family protein [Actinomycetota bacterium]
MGKKKDDKAGEDGEKKKSPVKLIGMCVALAGVGYMLGGRGAAATPASATTTTIVQLEGCAPGTDAMTAEHNTLDLESMSINLNDGHYLRVTVSLGLCPGVIGVAAGEGAGEPLNAAPAKDIIVSTLSGNSMATLQEPEGRENIKELLAQRLANAYPDEVHEVYFLEFVMQ